MKYQCWKISSYVGPLGCNYKLADIGLGIHSEPIQNRHLLSGLFGSLIFNNINSLICVHLRRKSRILFGVLCSASQSAYDSKLYSAESNLEFYELACTAQDLKLDSAEYNFESYALQLVLQRTPNSILHLPLKCSQIRLLMLLQMRLLNSPIKSWRF